MKFKSVVKSIFMVVCFSLATQEIHFTDLKEREII